MAIDLSKLVYSNTATPYMDAYKEYAKRQQSTRTTDVDQMKRERNADIKKSNAGYDNTAKQNYINYMQAQKRLPSELNSLGIRGGASESSLIRLGSNYGTNVANNESARQTALADIRNAFRKQVADYNSAYKERLANAEATARENQLKWEKERVEKDLQYFSGAIEGLYNDRASYQNLISKLQASNDPNKEYKIMLATREMNKLAAANASSGGGGGGGYRRSYGGGGYSSGGYSSGGGSNNNSASDYTQMARSIVNSVAGGLGAAVGSAGAKPSGHNKYSGTDWNKRINNRIWANRWSR